MKIVRYIFLILGFMLFLSAINHVNGSGIDLIDDCVVYADNGIIMLTGPTCSSLNAICECADGQCCEAGGGICECKSCSDDDNDNDNDDSDVDDDDGIDWIELIVKLLPIIYSL